MGSAMSNNEHSELPEAVNRRVNLDQWNHGPVISAFIPADVTQRGVVFIDRKSWRMALYPYPKSRCFCCIGYAKEYCTVNWLFAVFFLEG